MHDFKSAWLSVSLFVGLSVIAQAGEKYRFEEPVDDTRVFGVGTRIDINGKTQPSPKDAPMQLVASAALSYRERRLLGPGTDAESFRSARDYEQAATEIDAGGQKSSVKLAENLKLMVAQGRSEGVERDGSGIALARTRPERGLWPC